MDLYSTISFQFSAFTLPFSCVVLLYYTVVLIQPQLLVCVAQSLCIDLVVVVLFVPLGFLVTSLFVPTFLLMVHL